MADKEEWQEVKVGDAWNFEENPELVGTFVSSEEGVGPNNSMLYTVEVDGKNISVWGSTVLDTRLKNVQPGQKIKIVYLGKEPSEKRKGSSYKNFQVFKKPLAANLEVDENTSQENGAEADKDDLPF